MRVPAKVEVGHGPKTFAQLIDEAFDRVEVDDGEAFDLGRGVVGADGDVVEMFHRRDLKWLQEENDVVSRRRAERQIDIL